MEAHQTFHCFGFCFFKANVFECEMPLLWQKLTPQTFPSPQKDVQNSEFAESCWPRRSKNGLHRDSRKKRGIRGEVKSKRLIWEVKPLSLSPRSFRFQRVAALLGARGLWPWRLGKKPQQTKNTRNPVDFELMEHANKANDGPATHELQWKATNHK